MIGPWQVWHANLLREQDSRVLVVSSLFHLRLTSGRQVSIVPLLGDFRMLDYRVKVFSPEDTEYFAATDQLRTIDTVHLVGEKPAWELEHTDIERVAEVLRHMVDFA